MGPSPFMSQGYVLFDSGHVQHARVAVQTDPTAERAVLELQAVQDPERPQKRMVGKQPMEPMLPQLPPPRLSDDPGLCTVRCNSAGEPVLHQGRTGVESLQLSMPLGAHVKVNGGGRALVCKECGLQMAHSLRTEGLHPAEADAWPEWMGISTSVGQRPTTPAVKLEEDSQSDGSFEKLA